ncbi:sel1 repeat family protein [Lysobacter sp. 5GHs7-4]|uniref:tetratricopeptide repeat protein n=1 Tax=Lysobacter sp. 5GHs7-4 TaxID=2904253 RepID=UPI001E5C8709|nr:tetratricopeptide repeat protein [Lysobacter sp. 5GHs7-4]UHQ23078.1 sel1 repeat family protein [Lysobacter sp. 5GHs7-4]
MRGWVLCLALLAAPAMAADELAEMNAVSQAWDRYAQTSSKDDPVSATLVAPSTLRHYLFLRDAARAASADQMRRIPIADRTLVYALRASQTDAQLTALDGPGIARLCFSRGWCGVVAPDKGESLPALSHVTLIGTDRAVGELGPPTGANYQFGPEFVRADGDWKVMPESLVPDESAGVLEAATQAGMSEEDMAQAILAQLLGDDTEAPALASLGQPLQDDSGLRASLNDRWPNYLAPYKTRQLALERKAEDGDSLAQLGLGAMLYSGQPSAWVVQDKVRGMKLLEQASEGGNATAAFVVLGELLDRSHMTKGKPIPAERLIKALPHIRRSAESGQAPAMGMLSDLYFNGAAGLKRDCRQADEWVARAEDAGAAKARNNRIWNLAVCPIPEQRDPARALALAQRMIEQADTLSGSELDTVAAVYAANGKFDEAVDFQKRAIAKFDADGAAQTSQRARTRLKAYSARRDWVQDYNALELPIE